MLQPQVFLPANARAYKAQLWFLFPPAWGK